MRHAALLTLAALAGCATITNYQLTAMPRDSGRLYSGTATDNGSTEGPISITIDDKSYTGTWVQTRPSSTSGYVSGGYGAGYPGRGGWYGAGGFISMDNPAGGAAKALLTASDGSGLRCDFKSGQGSGGGECRDDKGRLYDVQVRATK